MNNLQTKLIRGMTLAEYDRKIADLRSLSADLGLPVLPDLHIGIKVEDRNGLVLTEFTEQGHSWTRNSWNIFSLGMLDCSTNLGASATGETTFRKGSLTTRDINGGFNSISTTGGFGNRVGSLNGSQGIMVGTSAEPFNGEDYMLLGLVGPGTGTNQLSYQAQVAQGCTYDGSTSTYLTTNTRVFNNNSPATIVLNEVGLASSSYLFSRDILSSPVIVPVGGQLTVVISITSTSFSAIDALCPPPLVIGSTAAGGTYLGYNTTWTNSIFGALNSHTKYALVLSPKVGGEFSIRTWRTSGTATTITGGNDLYYGGANSAYLVTLGADSGVGQAITSANAANLGGYNDWYLPSYYELLHLTSKLAFISTVEQGTNGSMWASNLTGQGSATGYTLNFITGASANPSISASTVQCRLIRRHKLV